MEGIEKEISKILIKVGHDLGLEPNKKLKLETSSQYGHYLKIARNVFVFLCPSPPLCLTKPFLLFSFLDLQDSAKIRNSSQYIELSTTKGGIYFTTSKLKPLSDQYTQFQSAYDKQQATLVKEVINIVCRNFNSVFSPPLKQFKQ